MENVVPLDPNETQQNYNPDIVPLDSNETQQNYNPDIVPLDSNETQQNYNPDIVPLDSRETQYQNPDIPPPQPEPPVVPLDPRETQYQDIPPPEPDPPVVPLDPRETQYQDIPPPQPDPPVVPLDPIPQKPHVSDTYDPRYSDSDYENDFNDDSGHESPVLPRNQSANKNNRGSPDPHFKPQPIVNKIDSDTEEKPKVKDNNPVSDPRKSEFQEPRVPIHTDNERIKSPSKPIPNDSNGKDVPPPLPIVPSKPPSKENKPVPVIVVVPKPEVNQPIILRPLPPINPQPIDNKRGTSPPNRRHKGSRSPSPKDPHRRPIVTDPTPVRPTEDNRNRPHPPPPVIVNVAPHPNSTIQNQPQPPKIINVQPVPAPPLIIQNPTNNQNRNPIVPPIQIIQNNVPIGNLLPDDDDPSSVKYKSPPGAPKILNLPPSYGSIEWFKKIEILPPPNSVEMIGDVPTASISQHGLITHEEAKNALIAFVKSDCCYGKNPAEEAEITKIVPTTAVKYSLETFTERRFVTFLGRSYTGGPIDLSSNGPIPAVWDIEAPSSEHFKSSTFKKTVPHTEQIMDCFRCGSFGKLRCSGCSGKGKRECTFCHGRKYTTGANGQNELCPFCRGQGIQDCIRCNGRGFKVCHQCNGSGKLTCYLELEIVFVNHKDEHVIEHTDLPDQLIKSVTGEVILLQTFPSVPPISECDYPEIITYSNKFVNIHKRYIQTEFPILQRQKLEAIIVFEVHYIWKEESYRFWIYGSEHKVYFADYPQECCCCCCCCCCGSCKCQCKCKCCRNCTIL